MTLESNYSSEISPGEARKRRKDNEEETKWKKMKDIEATPTPTHCLRGSWSVWGIEEEERKKEKEGKENPGKLAKYMKNYFSDREQQAAHNCDS